MVTTQADLVQHLYRRAGFGATKAEVTVGTGQSWAALVDGLLAGLSATDTAGDKVPLPVLTSIPEGNVPGYQWNAFQEWNNLITWWIQRMIVTDTPLREKLTLLLHCQFPTSFLKVRYASLMHTQNQIFRTLGAGSFEALTQAVAVDPSMLIWLDTDSSHKTAPNQNFARELMERFTMGVGNYSQEDVIQGARCFTGWELDRTTGRYYLNTYDHDDGIKSYLGHRGNLSGADVITIATSTAASHRWVVSRLWSWLAYPVTPQNSIVTGLSGAYSRDLDIGSLLSAILFHPAFRSSAALNGLVKQPVEYVVGSMRTLGLETSDLPDGSLSFWLGRLGQQPFAPPSVGGWGDNGYWLTTASSNAYVGFAALLAAAADLTGVERHNGNPTAQIAAVRELVGLPLSSPRTAGALTLLANDLKGSQTSWAAQQLVTLALVSPDYMTN